MTLGFYFDCMICVLPGFVVVGSRVLFVGCYELCGLMWGLLVGLFCVLLVRFGLQYVVLLCLF